MNKNYMEQVAEMLGLELREEFYISGSNILYRLTKQGVEYFDDETTEWRIDVCALSYLLVDGMEVIKRPWKPKNCEEYYYIYSNDNFAVEREYNEGTLFDLLTIKCGNCFRTEEEAERNIEAFEEYINGEPDTSWRVKECQK